MCNPVTLELLDVLNLSIALATIIGNSSAVVAPALNSLNEFFAQSIAVHTTNNSCWHNSSYRIYYRKSSRLGNIKGIRKNESRRHY